MFREKFANFNEFCNGYERMEQLWLIYNGGCKCKRVKGTSAIRY